MWRLSLCFFAGFPLKEHSLQQRKFQLETDDRYIVQIKINRCFFCFCRVVWLVKLSMFYASVCQRRNRKQHCVPLWVKSWSLPAPAPPQGSALWPGPRDRAHILAHILTRRHRHKHSRSHKHRTCQSQRAASRHRNSNPVSPASVTFPHYKQNSE